MTKEEMKVMNSMREYYPLELKLCKEPHFSRVSVGVRPLADHHRDQLQ